MKPAIKISEYDQQAIDFLESTGTKFEIVYTHTDKYFSNDTEKRDIYTFTLVNGKGSYSAKFGDSTYNTQRKAYVNLPYRYQCYSKGKNLGFKMRPGGTAPTRQESAAVKRYKPSAYDILACLDTYVPDTFEEFCSEFGYDDLPLHRHDDIMQIFLNVRAQSKGLKAMFTDEQLEQLAEIN